MPIALVSSADEKPWMRERARRITKTDATRLVNAGVSTFKRIYAEKTGEQKFKGNAATERGHRLEPVVQSWVEAHLGIPACNILYANEDEPMHAATPDSALEDDGEWSFVEIKTTKDDWSAGLPRKIIRDVLWQRYVLGAGYAAVAWWQVDEDGQPLTIEPQLVEVPYDERETQALIDGANAYLAWVDAGCPDHDDQSGLPLEIVEAVEIVARAKTAEKAIRAFLESRGESLNVTLPGGSMKYAYDPDADEFDKDAFLAANPEAALVVHAADDLLKSAHKDYRKSKVRTSLTIAPPKEQEEVAA